VAPSIDVRAQRQLEVAPAAVDRRRRRRGRVLLEPADDGHMISVSGGRRGYLADGGGASRAAQLDDAAARPRPPDGQQEPRGERGRAGPALVRVEQHPAPAAVVRSAHRRRRRRPAPAAAAAAEQRRVVTEDATRRPAAVLVVEQLDHDRARADETYAVRVRNDARDRTVMHCRVSR